MTFLELQDAVKSDRFAEEQRGDVRNWLNAAYWVIWIAEEWEFRYASKTVSVTAGSTLVTGLPTDFGNVRRFLRGDTGRIKYLDQVEYQDRFYSPRAPVTGPPSHYTVTNGVVTVGPASNETASDYLIVYEKEFTPLVNDDDQHALPPGSDFILVFAAAVIGLQIQNDFTWQFLEQSQSSWVASMRRNYLSNARDDDPSYAGDPLGFLG